MKYESYWTSDDHDPKLYVLRSGAESWTQLEQDLRTAWFKFAEIFTSLVPSDVRNEIRLSYQSDCGQVHFTHGRRVVPVQNFRWDLIPTDYIWSVLCVSDWLEGQWYDIENLEERDIDKASAELGMQFARVSLLAAQQSELLPMFQASNIGNIPVYGGGVTQSPAEFMVGLHELLTGVIPDMKP